MDTLLNVRLSLHCVRMARKEGFLLKSEGAHTAGLIDDAVQAVVLDESKRTEHCQAAADHHYKISSKTWKEASTKIDLIKTVYACQKFIFLNRLFYKGSEVLCPMKVYARSGREFNGRFATVHSQFDTIIGSFRAAV